MTTGGRTGRPPGRGENKELILQTARQEFASKGFRGATMRSIAARAGVDIALLAHYFGNKANLFAATIELPDLGNNTLAAALSGAIETRGERVTRWYLGLWEDLATRDQMKTLARSGLVAEAASDRISELLVGTNPTVSPSLPNSQDPSSLALALSHLLGIAITRHIAHLPAVANLDFETLIARTAPAVQLHLTPTTR